MCNLTWIAVGKPEVDAQARPSMMKVLSACLHSLRWLLANIRYDGRARHSQILPGPVAKCWHLCPRDRLQGFRAWWPRDKSSGIQCAGLSSSSPPPRRARTTSTMQRGGFSSTRGLTFMLSGDSGTDRNNCLIDSSQMNGLLGRTT